MDILGFRVSAPRLPSLSEVRQTASRTVQHAREFGDAAVSRARDLGRQGADLGRRAIADPEGTARSLAGTARRGIDRGISSAQTGVRDGVMWTGRQIGRGAEAARQAVPGDNAVSRVVRNTITGAENRARFTVGVAGGVVNEAVGLAGTVGTLGVTAAELQVSPTARAELGNAVAGAVRSGARAVGDYGQAVAADPGRVLRDARASAGAALEAGEGFIEGQVNRHQEAFRRGEGFETLGMTTGQVATYLVPVGAGGRAAATGARGLEAVAGGARVVAREAMEEAVTQGTRVLAHEGGEGALRAAGAETGVARLTTSPAAREAAEAAGSRLVARAEAGGGTVQVARTGGITAQDLAAASRQAGREVALYRDVASGERYVTMGSRGAVEVPQGSRVIAHVQPGAGASAVRASVADEAALSHLGQSSSVIIDEAGTAATRFRVTEEGAALARAETGPIRLHSPQVGQAELDAFRARIGVAKTETVAAARTDIAGLEAHVFEGASPKVLREAGLPQAAPGPIASPSTVPLFTRHAEENIANQLARAIDGANLPAGALKGREVAIHVSQEVCTVCKSGLLDASKPAGVLRQLSERYPELKIVVTAEGSKPIVLQNGVRVAQ